MPKVSCLNTALEHDVKLLVGPALLHQVVSRTLDGVNNKGVYTVSGILKNDQTQHKTAKPPKKNPIFPRRFA